MEMETRPSPQPGLHAGMGMSSIACYAATSVVVDDQVQVQFGGVSRSIRCRKRMNS